AHAPRHEGEVGDAEDDGPAADVASPHHSRVLHARLGLLGHEPLVVRQTILEAQRIARPQVGEPLLETVGVEKLLDPILGRHVEVVLALGTHAESALRFFGESGCLAARAAHPEAFRHSAFWPGHNRHGRNSPWHVLGLPPRRWDGLPTVRTHPITTTQNGSVKGFW